VVLLSFLCVWAVHLQMKVVSLEDRVVQLAAEAKQTVSDVSAEMHARVKDVASEAAVRKGALRAETQARQKNLQEAEELVDKEAVARTSAVTREVQDRKNADAAEARAREKNVQESVNNEAAARKRNVQETVAKEVAARESADAAEAQAVRQTNAEVNKIHAYLENGPIGHLQVCTGCACTTGTHEALSKWDGPWSGSCGAKCDDNSACQYYMNWPDGGCYLYAECSQTKPDDYGASVFQKTRALPPTMP